MDKTIFLITVFSKCEPDERWFVNIGSSRSVGFRHSFKLAEEVVKTNTCDIWERCYDYACIEELGSELYPVCQSRKIYKYNKNINGYEEIPEPKYLKHITNIGDIG